ncbi:MAG: hypothetical protein BroJett025_00910 [Patescibacteria group bacterium]|nr:MAG: hypothetical protein BroJett025_00910 [Patescibacteria group bacterium]
MNPVHPEVSSLHEVTVNLPKSFDQVLMTWPELKSLLESFAHRDPGTFMHSVAVHHTATRLAQDLFLRLKLSFSAQQSVFFRAPFWLLHDIGKTAADIDSEVAKKLVHPADRIKRPSYDRARHWLHPQMGGDLLRIWAKTTSPRLQPFVQKWAFLAHIHDRQLNKYLIDFQTQVPNWSDTFSLFLFSLCDTAMAMGLPRPNKDQVYTQDQIRQVLHKTNLKESVMSGLFPNENLNQLRHYILASIFSSLSELQKSHPPSAWTNPVGFVNKNFNQNLTESQRKLEPLEDLIVTTWRERERNWEKTMLTMDKSGVF